MAVCSVMIPGRQLVYIVIARILPKESDEQAKKSGIKQVGQSSENQDFIKSSLAWFSTFPKSLNKLCL